mgnify:CR=1 FL=1
MGDCELLGRFAQALGFIRMAIGAEALTDGNGVLIECWQQVASRAFVMTRGSGKYMGDQDMYLRGLADGCHIGAIALTDIMEWLELKIIAVQRKPPRKPPHTEN